MPFKIKHPFRRSIRTTFFFLSIFFIPVTAFSKTKAGSIEFLKSCNGFNGIKLGSDIREIPIHKLTYMDGNNQPDADSCMTYVYQDEEVLKVDSDFSLAQIGIRTFRNKIVNIYLFFKMADSYKVLRDFLKNYGQFNELPLEYADIYNWNTTKVDLSLKYQAKIEMGIAVFTCNALAKQIAAINEERKTMDNTIRAYASTLVDSKDPELIH